MDLRAFKKYLKFGDKYLMIFKHNNLDYALQ